jgi:threonine dehydratase
MTASYLKKILAARVYDVAVVTPLEYAPSLSRCMGNRVYLKREDMQPVFSFKLRGAYNKMLNLQPAQRQRGVICASAGNHAQGVALSASLLRCRALIVMPTTTPAVKIDAVRQHGGAFVDIVLHGESYTDAFRHAHMLETELQLNFVHPFDDPDVIAGQGTIGMEMLRQHPDPIHAIFVAVGGGGLIAGIGAYVKECRPNIKIIGIQMTDSDAMSRSLRANERITMPEVGLFSDGTAVRLVGEETFRIAQKVVDEMIVVDTDAVCAAIEDVFQDTRRILEPAGALAVAGMKAYIRRQELIGQSLRDKTLIAVAGGANIDFGRLKFVSERAEQQKSLHRTMPECR